MPPIVQLSEWNQEFASQATAALKTLLQTKHLYQSETVDTAPLFAALSKDGVSASVAVAMRMPGAEPWKLSNGSVSYSPPALIVRPPDVKLFCQKCDSREAFNLVAADVIATAGGVQVFGLTYLCQACKAVPDVFLVRRDGVRLTLCGRAPMENVEVPDSVPNRTSIRSDVAG